MEISFDLGMPNFNSKPKIFIFLEYQSHRDVLGVAISEDGNVLAQHLSSNEGWAKHDMGITSDWKHEEYSKYYKDGYELVYINDDTHEQYKQLQDALDKNSKKHQNQESQA